MSDSYRFMVHGTLRFPKRQNKPAVTGPFYIKQENGWRIYVQDKDFLVTFFLMYNGEVVNQEDVILDPNNPDASDRWLSQVRAIIAEKDKGVLQEITWIGNFVSHNHLKHH